MGQLHEVAQAMRSMLATTEARYVHHRLNRGLELVLERTERGYRLALGRPDAPPSDLEVELCQAAFHVPPGVDATLTTKQRSGKAGPRTYHVAEMTWIELN